MGYRFYFPNIPLYQLGQPLNLSQGTQTTSQYPRLDVVKCNCMQTCTLTYIIHKYKQTYEHCIHVHTEKRTYKQKFPIKSNHRNITYITRYTHTHAHTHMHTHATHTVFKPLAMLHPTLRLCTPANG